MQLLLHQQVKSTRAASYVYIYIFFLLLHVFFFPPGSRILISDLKDQRATIAPMELLVYFYALVYFYFI